MAVMDTPPRCVDTCLIARRDDLASYGIFLTRNCEGPYVSRGDDIDSRVQIRKGGIAEEVGRKSLVVTTVTGQDRVVEFVDSTDGIICRNTGANESINEALSKGKV